MTIILNGTTGITTPDITSTTSTLGALTQALNLGSTGQIVFPATQSASSNANTLDDYEEGTWTPSYTNGNITAYNCTYTKIGRVVTAIFTIQFTSTSTLFGTISGLPFSVANNNYLSTHSREWYSTGKSTQCVTTTGATAFSLYFYDNSQAVANNGIYGIAATLIYHT
tara:strand:+ start:1331 stop:1834 length:504 start_codon:yes stop_codon:yes gene_type:complete